MPSKSSSTTTPKTPPDKPRLTARQRRTQKQIEREIDALFAFVEQHRAAARHRPETPNRS